MNKRILKTAVSIFVFAILATNVFSQTKISGTVKDRASGSPVPYATATLLRPDSSIITGALTGDEGQFVIENVAAGNYLLQISLIGYEKSYRTVNVPSQSDLGEILISESASNLQEVVVRAERITRLPDRFIVNLANDRTVFGKTGTDILNQSPGVLVQERDGSITINGKTGTRVYINERPRHESGADLVRYLQTLRAEDIMRIEVLPMAGAEYDADIDGGVIKITLKRQRDDGINGSIGARGSLAPKEDVSQFNPFLNMNYKNNRLSLYAQLNYQTLEQVEHVIENTAWKTGRNVHSVFDFPVTTNTGRVRIGGIYDLSERQSFGLEANYSRNLRKNKSFANLTETSNGNQINITSLYTGRNTANSYSASANYLLQLDESGSLFKILLDYHHNETDDRQNYYSEFRGYIDYDSTYRSNMFTSNNLYAANADLSLKFNDYTIFTAGVKYVHNRMDNEILFEYLKELNWNEIEQYSSLNSFSEDIAALYGKFTSRINKMSYSIGLRGEYTKASPWTDKSDATKKQHYFYLFPSVNVMFPLSAEGQHSLVLNYNRTIRRPSFSDLNPFRLPGTEYNYISGNPKLQPALTDDASISFRLFNRYNLIAGMTETKNDFGRVWITNPDEPGIIVQQTDNIAAKKTWYLSLNAPVNPTKWWQIYLNMRGYINNIEIFGEKRSINVFSGYIGNVFSLPKEFMLDINGNYQTPVFDGSVKFRFEPQVNIALRKQFFSQKLSVNLFVNNLFDMGIVKATANEKDFSRNLHVRSMYRQFGLSLSYSFQSGKSIQVKNVETGAAEEKARLQ